MDNYIRRRRSGLPARLVASYVIFGFRDRKEQRTFVRDLEPTHFGRSGGILTTAVGIISFMNAQCCSGDHVRRICVHARRSHKPARAMHVPIFCRPPTAVAIAGHQVDVLRITEKRRRRGTESDDRPYMHGPREMDKTALDANVTDSAL